MRHLRKLMVAIGLATMLVGSYGCAARQGPQDAASPGGGIVKPPAAPGALPDAGTGNPGNPPADPPPGTNGAAGLTAGSMGSAGSMDSTSATGSTAEADAAKKVDCSTVRCAACPEGQTPSLKPPNCCKCVDIDKSIRDCSNVRCAACPEGQRPALKPPDCCRCIPA